jgi:PAS domain S-box-containing protein
MQRHSKKYGNIIRHMAPAIPNSDPADHIIDLRVVLDSAPALIHTAMPDGNLDFFNESWLKYVGWPQQNLLGWQWTSYIHPDDVEGIVKSWRHSLATGDPFVYEARVRRGDGTYRWMLHHKIALRDANGKIVKWYGSSIDIEDRKQAEDQLQRSKVYLAEAQRLSRTGSFGWRIATGEIFWSDETYRIFNCDPTTKPTIDFILGQSHPEDRARVQELLAERAHSGKDFECEHRLLLTDGSVKTIHVVAHAQTDKSGTVELIGAVLDVTQARQATSDLEKAFREIQELKDRLYKENIALRDEIDKSSMFEEIVGASPQLQNVLSQISRVAPTDSTVLITGETGTGKELVARAIHRRSERASRAFVSVNCAAIPRDLVASELFGHEKGAFTGALQRRLGRFELAEGGTIFLDEAGELPAETQSALLRVLQEYEFERVGGTRPIRTDVRVIAATNRDLNAAIAAGSFRKDLFYRLNVFPIDVPSLRERKEDIPMLVEYFVDRFARKSGRRIKRVEKKTLDLLQGYSWPGNIRELQNVLERSVILSDTENLAIDESWFSSDPPQAARATPPLAKLSAGQEKEIIEKALRDARGRVSGKNGAAAKLGVPASTLESRIRALRINKYSFKAD